MSIQSEIDRLSGNVAAALSAIEANGVSVPAGSKSDELASLIASIKEGIDTSDADATEADIKTGKTAYVNGVKLTGTHVCEDTGEHERVDVYGSTYAYTTIDGVTDILGASTNFNSSSYVEQIYVKSNRSIIVRQRSGSNYYLKTGNFSDKKLDFGAYVYMYGSVVFMRTPGQQAL